MAMSFKCSVFGHAYGDSEIEREREEDGSEVVTTIRETETCQRCGETRVVSENKEVTTLETAADIVAGDLDSDDSEDDDPSTELNKSVDAPETVEESETTAPPETEPTVESPPEPPEEPTEPESSEPETMGAAEVVETVEETDPEADDGVILEDEEDEPDEQADRQPGEWPEEPDDGDDQWEPETEVDPTPESDREIEPAGSAVTVPEGEFHCPECEFTTPVAESSLRRGDFCPECHRGALEHVTE